MSIRINIYIGSCQVLLILKILKSCKRLSSQLSLLQDYRIFRSNRKFLMEIVDAGVGMVEAPVEPVILEDEHLLQFFSGQRSASRFAFEVPGAPGFRVDQLDSATVSFLKELQSPSLDCSLKRTHRTPVITKHDHDRRRSHQIDDRALF